MSVEPWDGGSLPDVLVESNPPSDDPVSQGDDHLRLVKTVVSNFYTLYLDEMAAIAADIAALEAAVASGSVYNAARLGGELPAYYTNAANMSSGILPAARLSGTYGINISGNAATATLATDATHAGAADTALLAADSSKLGGMTLAQVLSSLPTNFSYSTVAAFFVTTGWTTVLTVPLPVHTTARNVTGKVSFIYNPGAPVFNFSCVRVRAMPSGRVMGWVSGGTIAVDPVVQSKGAGALTTPASASGSNTYDQGSYVMLFGEVLSTDVSLVVDAVASSGATLTGPSFTGTML